MDKQMPIGLKITEDATGTLVDSCNFHDCGIEDSGTGTQLIRNRFSLTKDWIVNRPTWIKVVIFLSGAIVTAVIARAIEKFWV